jgi:hypothetical protein
MLKRIFLIVVLIGALLGYFLEKGTVTGIQVIDENMAALDVSLRRYVLSLEGYMTAREADAPRRSISLDALVERAAPQTQAELEQLVGEDNDEFRGPNGAPLPD